MLAVRIIMRSASMVRSPPFTGDGSGAGAGAGTVITFPPSPSIPGGSGGISITGGGTAGAGAGAGAGLGAGAGAGASAGAAQASNAAFNIIRAITINNLFIKTSWLLCSLYKTQIGVKSNYLGKTSQLTAAYFH